MESAKQEEQERSTATSDARKPEGQREKAPAINQGTSYDENIRRQMIPTVVVGLPEREERGTLQKIKDWMTNLMEEKIDSYRSQSIPNQDLKEYQDMMKLMIDKARLEETIRATGCSSGSGGDFVRARRWNRQRSKSRKDDSGAETLRLQFRRGQSDTIKNEGEKGKPFVRQQEKAKNSTRSEERRDQEGRTLTKNNR